MYKPDLTLASVEVCDVGDARPPLLLLVRHGILRYFLSHHMYMNLYVLLFCCFCFLLLPSPAGSAPPPPQAAWAANDYSVQDSVDHEVYKMVGRHGTGMVSRGIVAAGRLHALGIAGDNTERSFVRAPSLSLSICLSYAYQPFECSRDFQENLHGRISRPMHPQRANPLL